MVTRVQKWGNSQGLRITRQILADVDLTVGDEVDVAVRNGAIVITPVRRVRGKYRLEELVAKIPKGARCGEEPWGPPTGKEVW